MLRSSRCSRGSASVIAVPPRASPPGAADAVQVHLRRRRHVVVDDVREVLDVEAARGDVGGDQQVRLLRPEEPHHAIALPLHHAAVQRLRPGGRARCSVSTSDSTSSRVRQKTSAATGSSMSRMRARASPAFCARPTM